MFRKVHLFLMMFTQCSPDDTGQEYTAAKSKEKVHLMMDPPRLQIQLTNVLRQELQDPILILLMVQLR